MARTFPSKIGRVPKFVGRAFRQFKKLPDDYQVWFSLQAHGEGVAPAPQRPHCFILWREMFGFLVHVADASQPLAESALQATLFETEKSVTVAELGREEGEVLDGFSSGLRRELDGDFPLCKLVVFPAVEHGTIEAISLQRADAGTHFLGLQKLGATSLPGFLEGIAEAALPPPCLLQLRRSFSPETAVPSEFSALAPAVRNTGASLTGGLLDLDQEWCMKNDLHLPEEAEALATGAGEADSRSSQLVTGVAGSGKSLVLLYRSLLNARLNPDASVLVLTHNRPLNYELQRRADQLQGMPSNLHCLTFFQWAHRKLSKIGEWDYPDRGIIAPSKTESILGRLLYSESAQSGAVPMFEAAFLGDEIAWIKDQNIRRREEYLEAERGGRGTALRGSQREQVWRYFVVYQKRLKRDGLIDWHGVALRFHDAAMAGRLGFPRYDCILVDEAQFFAKAWFDIVNAALNPGGQLFLAADPTQGFLRRRQSWLASGIDVRGRTTRLRQAYRNSRCILRFAAAFFKARQPGDGSDEVEDLNIPTEEQVAAISVEGERPDVITCASSQDVRARAAAEIAALRAGGQAPGQVLVLDAGCGGDNLRQDIAAEVGGAGAVHDAKLGQRPATAFCQISTLNAATGLEAPVVFLLGIEHLLEKEDSPKLGADERRELLRDNTRQLYMAFTRAGQRLIILTHNPGYARWLENLARL